MVYQTNEPYIDYICPKCKAKISSRTKLKYCVCVAKYVDVMEQFFGPNPLTDMFGGDNDTERSQNSDAG